ncbi:hypothetical protein TSMEX_006154 [Taenia solium]|eukprot:TsM_000579300 transcript=TsM_000579300 gene=TsM_000579300
MFIRSGTIDSYHHAHLWESKRIRAPNYKFFTNRLPASKSSTKADLAPPRAVDLHESSELTKCRSMLNWRQEKIEQLETTLKETRKQLKNRDELYESCRNKLLELQEKIIDRQQDESPDCRPFYQKAFDKIFGYHTGRKFRERRNKWRN